MLVTGKGLLLSAALAAANPAKVRAQLEASRAHSSSDPADVEAGLAIWRQWAADANVSTEALAPVLGRLLGCSGETVAKALAKALANA